MPGNENASEFMERGTKDKHADFMMGHWSGKPASFRVHTYTVVLRVLSDGFPSYCPSLDFPAIGEVGSSSTGAYPG